MTTPKYRGVDEHCKYNPQTERVESVALMNGPVFKGVESANQYGAPGTMEGPRLKSDKVMSVPKYPGVDASNQYYPQLDNIPDTGKPMAGPVYPGIESSNKYAPKSERVQSQGVFT